MGPFLDRDTDDDNDDNDDDSDDSDENLEEWLNNSGKFPTFNSQNGRFSRVYWFFVFAGSDDEEINIFNIEADGGGKFKWIFSY